MERSVYIIKPEGMPRRHEIREMIEKMAGLAIVGSITTVLPEWALAKLYPDLAQEKNELWLATLEHLAHSECEIGIVEGENAVQRFFELCGEMTSPLQCRSGTIRLVFGKEKPVRVGEKLYWRNVIHRSKNQQEAESDLRIAQELITPGSH